MRLCKSISHIYEAEPRCVFLQSPVYVFGDIHGNLEVSITSSFANAVLLVNAASCEITPHVLTSIYDDEYVI